MDSVISAEVTLIEKTFDNVSVSRKGTGLPRKRMERLIYDKAANSEEFRERLKKRGIELIAPHPVESQKKENTGR